MSLIQKLIFILVFITATAKAEVWPSQNVWTIETENQYSEWVEKYWDDEIFMRKDSDLYGFATDCADASYAMRAYFSYLNQLPFKILNPNKVQSFYTNQTNNYDSIPNSRDRFLAFLKDVVDGTDSASLSRDTYPIEINRKYMRAGTVYVAPNDHSYQVKKISDNGVPIMYASTVPKEVRYLLVLNSFPFYIPLDFINFRDGFRVFKQPQHYGVKSSQLPGYSLQQFEISKSVNESILEFGDVVSGLLANVPETFESKIERSVTNLCHSAQDRALTVAWTVYRNAQNSNQCLNAADYDANSTPGRDRRFKLMYTYAMKVFNDSRFKSNLTAYSGILDAVFSDKVKNTNMETWCPINKYTQLDQPTITLRTIWQAMQSGTLVSDPNANVKQRWGVEPYVPTCQQY